MAPGRRSTVPGDCRERERPDANSSSTVPALIPYKELSSWCITNSMGCGGDIYRYALMAVFHTHPAWTPPAGKTYYDWFRNICEKLPRATLQMQPLLDMQYWVERQWQNESFFSFRRWKRNGDGRRARSRSADLPWTGRDFVAQRVPRVHALQPRVLQDSGFESSTHSGESCRNWRRNWPRRCLTDIIADVENMQAKRRVLL